jgi:hypothetical protein
VHLAPLIDGARELRRELAIPAVPDQRRQVASQRLRELGTEMLGLQRDFYQAQSVSNLLVPGADTAMSTLFETLELDDAIATDPLDLDAVQRAATAYLAEARKTLRIRGGEQRAWWRGRASHES